MEFSDLQSRQEVERRGGEGGNLEWQVEEEGPVSPAL